MKTIISMSLLLLTTAAIRAQSTNDIINLHMRPATWTNLAGQVFTGKLDIGDLDGFVYRFGEDDIARNKVWYTNFSAATLESLGIPTNRIEICKQRAEGRYKKAHPDEKPTAPLDPRIAVLRAVVVRPDYDAPEQREARNSIALDLGARDAQNWKLFSIREGRTVTTADYEEMRDKDSLMWEKVLRGVDCVALRKELEGKNEDEKRDIIVKAMEKSFRKEPK